MRVHVRIQEDEKSRIQPFEGLVIARRGASSRETFTVRRISYGEGVERTFPLHSPFIEKIRVVRRGSVRRAKLYYLRKKTGKAARISSAVLGGGQEDTPGGSEPLERSQETPAAPPVRPEHPLSAKT